LLVVASTSFLSSSLFPLLISFLIPIGFENVKNTGKKYGTEFEITYTDNNTGVYIGNIKFKPIIKSNSLVKEEKKEIIYRFYRKFYTLTLSKSYLNVGINRSPTRDLILDYPWFVLGEDRLFCLKIWETINK
jgi:hypothetical protein